MKRTLTLIVILLSLTACGQTEVAPTVTNTPIPPTATAIPSVTFTPEPSSTPTPVPYYLEDGSLYDLDETTGEYALVAEGIADITTSTDGNLVAIDVKGDEKFRYNADAGEWEAVEKVYYAGMDPELWNKVEGDTLEYIRTSGEFGDPAELAGMRDEELWDRFFDVVEANKNYSEGMSYGTTLGFHWGAMNTSVTSLENTPGFSEGDRIFNVYLARRSSNEEVISKVAVPLFMEKNGKFAPLTWGYYRYTRGQQEYVFESFDSFDQAVEFMRDQLSVGTVVFMKTQASWNDEDLRIFPEYRDALWQLLTPEYIERMNQPEAKAELFDSLEPSDPGAIPVQFLWYVEE